MLAGARRRARKRAKRRAKKERLEFPLLALLLAPCSCLFRALHGLRLEECNPPGKKEESRREKSKKDGKEVRRRARTAGGTGAAKKE